MRRLALIVLVFIASVVQPRIGFAGDSPRASMTEAAYRGLPNLVANGSFEMDWMHNRVTVNTRFLLLEQSDWGYAQPDGQPDYWIVSEPSRLDTQRPVRQVVAALAGNGVAGGLFAAARPIPRRRGVL